MEVPWLLPVSCHDQTRGHHRQYCNRNKQRWDKIWADNNKTLSRQWLKLHGVKWDIKNFVNEWLQAPEAIQSRQLPDQITMPIPMAGIQANKETQNTKNATIQRQNTKGIAIKAPPELIPTPIAAPMSPRVAKPPAPVLSFTCCYQTIITLLSHCNHTVITL